MGCQRNIAKKIIARKADYILALKGNQGTLHEDVELFANEQKANGFKDTTISRHETIDGDHGRIETEHAPANFTTLKHIAHNLIRKAPGKDSLRLRRKTAAWDDDFLARLVAA